MTGQINSIGKSKTLGDMLSSMKMAGKLGKARGIKSTGQVKVGTKKVATRVQGAAKVGTKGSAPPNKLPTFKEAAKAAFDAMKVAHGTKKGKVKTQPVPPHAPSKNAPPMAAGVKKHLLGLD